jgi:predicted ArsR family transcriptional regulator
MPYTTDGIGYQHRDTSHDAAKSMEPTAHRLRAACLMQISFFPATADEVASALEREVLAIRPRVAELAKENKIRQTGLRRPNASGRTAIVWEVTPILLRGTI